MKGIKYLKKFWFLYFTVIICFLAAAMGTDKAITTIAENSPVPRNNTIVIDAGHGGIDGGATSCTGILESNINLMIALKLEDLCHLLGIDTVMIRSSDVSVYTEGETIAAKKASDLRNRVKIVNETENAILVSIHQNTYPDSRYSGAQVFYAPTKDSQTLAMMLQQKLVDTVNPGSNRKCKSADKVYLMQHIQKTGVLIECGFLTNPEEEAKLLSDHYQKQICCVIASVLSCYLTT